MKLLDRNGRVIDVPHDRLIGEGHEAKVFAVTDDTLAKIYRAPHTYDQPHDRQAAKIRLDDHQKKLSAFPTNLPPRAIGPTSPLWTYRNWGMWKSRRNIIGYVMPWVKDAEEIDYYMIPRSRDEGVTDEVVVRALLSLHETLCGLHDTGLVMGDLNHGNVLVKGPQAWAIDLDAGQFASYLCNTFEPDYLDPKLMDTDPKLMTSVLCHDKSYSTDSDWYSFTCMVLACLTYVKPYQGTYDGSIVEERRPLDRLSVFHPKVIFPKYGGVRHWNGFLTDDLIAYFKKVFSREDLRGEFPAELLQALLPGGAVDGTSVLKRAPRLVWPHVEKVVTAEEHTWGMLFETKGTLVPITQIQDGMLRYLYAYDGDYVRDHRHVVIADESRAVYESVGQYRYCMLHGDQTLSVLNGVGTLHTPRLEAETFHVDMSGDLPSISSNGERLAWYEGGELMMAYDAIKERRPLWMSPHTTNKVWVTPQGRLVSYHRTDSKIAMSVHDGKNRHDLPVDFGQHRPQDLRVFEDNDYLWIWSWHSDEVHVRRFEKDGAPGPLLKIDRAWAPNPQLICMQRSAFFAVDADMQLAKINLRSKMKKTEIARIPFRGVAQLLSHPQKGGIVVIATQNQLWQLSETKKGKTDV